ncbi:porin [Aquamicrobium sp. NLF2-7]|uniref:porin n=1 Tax=Aquamicrobium sp. NLF2-7 TaxID=2918753 RepID=UPI001EFB6BFF|nr:porin [Aquamicrobium sp. NLF2-7]MCG8272999.1 porin [Aquamicrobium sp. NLF2-7]
MNIKSLLLGSAAALVAVSGARAADAIVVAEPEPAEYVRICDVYGAGYFYIPGTETCLKIGGYLRYDIGVGDALGLKSIDKKDAYNFIRGTGNTVDINDTYFKRMRAQLTFDARSETEYGTLRGFIATYYQRDSVEVDIGNDTYSDTASAWALEHAIIQLGGLTIAYTDSLFETLTDSAGSVINDGIGVNYTPGKTHLIAYTFDGGNGFSATIGVEEGSGEEYTLDSYVPHVVAGASFTQGWGKIAGVIGYDANFGEVAGKVRVDFNVNEALSLWVMAGYQDYNAERAWWSDQFDLSGRSSYYGVWGGDWAVWGGGQYRFNEKGSLDVQLAYDDNETFGAAVGVNYALVPGFNIRPEVVYASGYERDINNNKIGGKKDGWGGYLRFQRSF